jgi:superoxide reductase
VCTILADDAAEWHEHGYEPVSARWRAVSILRRNPMSDAPILGPVNQVEDLETAGDFEKKHTPFIAVEAVEDKTRISVKVGHYVPHPNEADHFIAWIEIYAGDAPIARFDLSPVATAPDVSVIVNVDPGTSVRAVEYCNLHGLWAAETTVS